MENRLRLAAQGSESHSILHDTRSFLQHVASKIAALLGGSCNLGFVHLVSVRRQSDGEAVFYKLGKTSMMVTPWNRGKSSVGLLTRYRASSKADQTTLELDYILLCRWGLHAWKCEQLVHGQMHRLHPDMLMFGTVWEVRQEAEGRIPKFLECYKPQARERLLDYLHQASSMDHEQIDHLLRQNWDWWRLNCGEILQKKLPVSTFKLFSPLRTSNNGARCSTSASMLTPRTWTSSG